jgi:hypothetical protein
LQPFNHLIHRFRGVEVRGHDLNGGHGDVEGLFDVGNQREDRQRIEDAVVDERLFVFEIDFGI